MFDRNSRYASLPVKLHAATSTEGEPPQIRYVARRFLPPPDEGTTIVEHTVADGERPDQIAAKYLGDPTRSWQIADANLAMDPAELTATPGRPIRVAIPGA